MSKHYGKITDDQNVAKAWKSLEAFTRTGDLHELDRARLLVQLAGSYDLVPLFSAVITAPDKKAAALSLLDLKESCQ